MQLQLNLGAAIAHCAVRTGRGEGRRYTFICLVDREAEQHGTEYSRMTDAQAVSLDRFGVTGRAIGQYRFQPDGQSDAMRAIHSMIKQVAPTKSNVLILGESGTGKEMVAHHIHELSARRGHAFVPVNCGAIPGELLESELFGHEKGAFTGALSTRIGRFQYAEGGTLFLDEIGDMSLQMQVKLLRVLQERCFERVGSDRSMHCDVRIIAATHRNLETAIRDGLFREDLFYRLNVFPLEIPPLRVRIGDLPLLIENLQISQGHIKGPRLRLTKAALECLMRYPWPGNVRELSNLLERLSILFPRQLVDVQNLPECYQGGPLPSSPDDSLCQMPPGELTSSSGWGAEELSDPSADRDLPPGGLDLKRHLLTIESKLIREALEKSHGIVANAARLLGMRRTTLVEKMRKIELSLKAVLLV